MPKASQRKKVVVIGGGTGTYQVLVGLKQYPLDLSAIVTMSDSGGSTGRLRREFSILPPGDVRRALIALSNLPIAEKTLEQLFDFRFQAGRGLKGHSMGNLLLAALTQITGREDLAIKEAGRILAVSGFVYPVTMQKTNLVAVLENGKRIIGESKIDLRWSGKQDADVPIKKVYLQPKARVFKEAEVAIKRADLIILGPGDLYTSVIPNLLVDGVNSAIAKSEAKVILIVNLMTKPGETDKFKASDFIKKIKEYLGPAQSRLSHVLVNTRFPDGVKTLAWYLKYSSEPVKDDLPRVRIGEVRVVRGVFTQKGELLRHDPSKLAKALSKIPSLLFEARESKISSLMPQQERSEYKRLPPLHGIAALICGEGVAKSSAPDTAHDPDVVSVDLIALAVKERIEQEKINKACARVPEIIKIERIRRRKKIPA